MKEARLRRFHIRRYAKSPAWFCQVWFDGVQHRGDTVTRMAAERLYAQYLREIAELRLDGWSEVTP
jgi:hypothetical protein